MTSPLSVEVPFPVFQDRDGQPLENGYVFLGVANLNPQTNPVIAYFDAALTIPAAQPLRTINGFISNAGTPAQVYVDGVNFSILVQDSKGSMVYNFPEGTGISPNASGVNFIGFKGQVGNVQNLAGDDGSDWIGFEPAGVVAVARSAQDKMRETVSVTDFGAVGDGVTDDTAAIQAAFDSIGDITAGAFQEISPDGVTLYFPDGRYLVTATLFVPSNIRMQGTGLGTQFTFDPASPNSNFIEQKNNNVGGSALNRSNFSMRFENFYVYAARDGGTITGRNGSQISTINTNTANCFNFTNTAFSSFTNVYVTDFWYGTAFSVKLPLTGGLFAFYNYMLGCYTRDCQLSVDITSAIHITDCYFSHGVAFPPPSIQANVQYAVVFDGRGCAMQGGSIECSCSIALIKQNNAGHTFTGIYMEAFGGTPAMMDASVLASDTGSLLLGGNSYGFTGNVLYNENITRVGSNAMTHGAVFGFGDCSEIEIEHFPTRQSPSFREGLPGRGHSPAGGTLTISTDSFIDNTSMALTRGAGTDVTDNQMSYNLVVRNSEKVLTNVWLTCLVKLEGGESNFSLRTFDSTNGTAFFKKQITFNNGWELWAGYLKRVDNSVITFFARQIAGSVDPSQVLYVTALRAYTNGFLPIPAPYKFQEFRTAAPTTGNWKRGDIVLNSEPSAGGPPGFVCTTGGAAGVFVFKAMANLAA